MLAVSNSLCLYQSLAYLGLHHAIVSIIMHYGMEICIINTLGCPFMVFTLQIFFLVNRLIQYVAVKVCLKPMLSL